MLVKHSQKIFLVFKTCASVAKPQSTYILVPHVKKTSVQGTFKEHIPNSMIYYSVACLAVSGNICASASSNRLDQSNYMVYLLSASARKGWLMQSRAVARSAGSKASIGNNHPANSSAIFTSHSYLSVSTYNRLSL